MAEALKAFLINQLRDLPESDLYHEYASGVLRSADAFSRAQSFIPLEPSLDSEVYVDKKAEEGRLLGAKLREVIGVLDDNDPISSAFGDKYLILMNGLENPFDKRLITTTLNALIRNDLNVGDLRTTPIEDLMKLRGVGHKASYMLHEASKRPVQEIELAPNQILEL